MQRALLITPLLTLTVLVAFQPADAGVPPPVHTVTFAYLPPVLVVTVGTTVTWDNTLPGALRHTISTADDVFDSLSNHTNDANDTNCAINGEPGEDGNPDTCNVELLAGTTFSHTFSNPGLITYYCQRHVQQRMTGFLLVV